METFPSISIIIPVYNSEKVLRDCLQSIKNQDYPQDKLEIIVLDGGSSDNTLEIAEEFEAIIKKNPLKTGEAGKAEGLKASTHEIISFIDSDNILPDNKWLKEMVMPFVDSHIIGSEPLYYTYRKKDGFITRYCALLGMNDPLCLFLGNYDRYSTLTGSWTNQPYRQQDMGDYLNIELDKKQLPTIGANGFFIRQEFLEKYKKKDYLFDVDVIYEVLNDKSIGDNARFAKVKTGIIHTFSGDIRTFARKQRRRVRDYLYYNKLGVRQYPWKITNNFGLYKFLFYCVTTVPLLAQSAKGFLRKPDAAWLFHPIACWITLWEYGKGRSMASFKIKEFERDGWSQ